MKYLLGTLFVAICSFCFHNVYSQDTVSDPEAEKLLKQVSENFQSFRNIKANFSLTIKEPEGEWVEEKKGTVFLDGDKFKIKMDDYMIVCDGKTSWMYSPTANEVQITYFHIEDDMFTPSQIFDIYNERYLYRIKSVNEGATTVELTPKDKDQSFFKVDIVVDNKTMTITNCMIYEKSGMRYIYNISDLESNLDLGDDFFVFKSSEYPGIEVIDLR